MSKYKSAHDDTFPSLNTVHTYTRALSEHLGIPGLPTNERTARSSSDQWEGGMLNVRGGWERKSGT